MDKPYYVILTGGKSNAGDYLIKYRAKKIFENFRSDREIIDFNAWEKFDDQKLKVVNSAQALILLGGPSIQKNMYPSIYGLVDNLKVITAPITTMGVGWKSVGGTWANTYNYPLSSASVELLKKCTESGLPLSVRDYHSQNMLQHKSFDNVLMTGCPAYYDLNEIESLPKGGHKIKSVAFSLGVSFLESPSMLSLMKEQILHFQERYKNKIFKVVFHHSLDVKKFMSNHGSTRKHVDNHQCFKSWLDQNNIESVDISGSAENLIEFYENIDLHIGYRVHAHIFMNSIGRLSVLISEDGRAKGSALAIGGMVVDGYLGFKDSFPSKALNKLFSRYDRYMANPNSTDDIDIMISHELKSQFQKTKKAGLAIRENFNTMKKYVESLP